MSLHVLSAAPTMSDATHSRERALLDQKEVYRQILDAIADMVLVKGAESHILWANKSFLDYYGMSNEQLYELIDAKFSRSTTPRSTSAMTCTSTRAARCSRYRKNPSAARTGRYRFSTR